MLVKLTFFDVAMSLSNPLTFIYEDIIQEFLLQILGEF